MKLSIVTTLYKSSPYIDEFYARISKEAQKITDDYEIIFVDDGSPDDSLQKAVALYEKDSKVKVIELSRNFGHHNAALTGLNNAKGDFVFLIDIDLEEEPELLGKFWEELHKEKDVDVVFGVQESRKGGWFEKNSGEAFYKVFNFLSPTKVTANQTTVRILTARFIKALSDNLKEKNLFLAGNLEALGFKQKTLEIKKQKRQGSNYTFSKKIQLMINSITSFSSKPLVYVFYLGSMISFFSFTYIAYLLIMRLFFGQPLVGWTSMIVSVWFMSGLIIFSIGVLGIYLSKIFDEVKQRPITIIKKIYEGNKND